jgi:hypothetical protein
VFERLLQDLGLERLLAESATIERFSVADHR